MNRCKWCGNDDLMIAYHDKEFGVPTHDDRKQFEHLSLEVLQCGLNWRYVIQRREIYRRCFDNFDFEIVAKYDDSKIEKILQTEGMLKSRNKVEAIIINANCFIKIREEFGSFSKYIWDFVENTPIIYKDNDENNLPSKNELSETIAADLKSRGFKYVGAINIYSHLQGVGIINDHFKNCYRYEEIKSLYPSKIL